jgi:hypothetical protein
MLQRGADAITQILRGIDQRAVQIEDQQFQGFDGKRTKNAKHDSIVTGAETELF